MALNNLAEANARGSNFGYIRDQFKLDESQKGEFIPDSVRVQVWRGDERPVCSLRVS
jgi:hypothetical protein